MRLDINLASHKYEDVRSFFMRWGAAIALMVAAAAILGGLAYLKYNRIMRAQQESRGVEDEIRRLTEVRNEAARIDNLPENRDITQEKKYWNAQLSRRALSWTQLINDLQKIMPNRAYLNSVQPEITPEGRVKLKIVITGEKKENALELQQRMENSTRFRAARISDETPEAPKPGMPATYKIDIESDYIQPETLPPSPQPTPAGKKGA